MRADATGLIPAVEALLATSTVRELIRDGSKIAELKAYMETAGSDLGMHSFDQYLYRLHETKRISLDSALANATYRADLERRIMMETGGRPA
jgi:twitching motility protein PilT